MKKTIFSIFVLLCILFAQTNAQEIKTLNLSNLPKKPNYSNWNKNRNMGNENYLIQWNGIESIAGESYGNGLAAAKKVYYPVNGKKVTLCGNLYRDVFFADKLPADLEWPAGAASQGEKELKIDCDLNIPIKPNSNYNAFWNHPRKKAHLLPIPLQLHIEGEVEPGYEGEVQIDNVKYSGLAQLNVNTGWNFFDQLGNAGLEAVNVVGDILTPKFYDNAEIIYTRNKPKYRFWQALKQNKEVCIYGSLTYDALNSPAKYSPPGTKTEIHPVEQLWYEHNGNIVFGTLFDKSLRYDQAVKNSSASPWIKYKQTRRFAMPFHIYYDYLGAKKVEIKAIESDNYAKEQLQYALKLNLGDNKIINLLDVFAEPQQIIKSFTPPSSPVFGNEMKLKFSVEDVFIDQDNPDIIRGLLIIEKKLESDFYELKTNLALTPQALLSEAKEIKEEKAKEAAKEAAKQEMIDKLNEVKITVTDMYLVQNGVAVGGTVRKCNTCSSADPNQYQLNIIGKDLIGWDLVQEDFIYSKSIIGQQTDANLKFNIMFKPVVGKTYSMLTLKKGSVIRKVPLKTPFVISN